MDEKGRIIDVHAHILPGVDDGARDMDEALKMLKCAASQGIRAVIATPHCSRRRGVSGLESLLDALQESIRKEYPDFALYPGQETYYHEELAECLNQGKALTMAGSRYVLVEFDPGVSYEYLFRGIRSLLYAGYFPVLAHVERYGCLYHEERFAELNDAGCVYQMNYNSLEGRWTDRRVRWCRKQVRSGRISFLGTDMHRMDFRPPGIKGAEKWMKSRGEDRLWEEMTCRNPMRLLSGGRIMPAEMNLGRLTC